MLLQRYVITYGLHEAPKKLFVVRLATTLHLDVYTAACILTGQEIKRRHARGVCRFFEKGLYV